MNRHHRVFQVRRSTLLRLALASACCLPALGACSEDEVAAPVVLGPVEISIVQLSGSPDAQGQIWVAAESGATVPLGCDRTLGVRVALSPAPSQYVLRPPQACGSAKQCLFVEVAALDADEQELAVVQVASTDALLPLDSELLASVTTLRASLLSASNGEPLLDALGGAVTSTLAVALLPPSDCSDGAGGAGGAATGGAGGAATGGASPSSGGASPAAGAPAGGAPSSAGGAGGGDASAGAGGR